MRILCVRRREAFGSDGDSHGRCQVSARPVVVPRKAQRVQHLGKDRVLSGRYQPDGRTVVPEVRRGKQMGRVQEVVSGRLVPETPTIVYCICYYYYDQWPLCIILYFMLFLRTA